MTRIGRQMWTQVSGLMVFGFGGLAGLGGLGGLAVSGCNVDDSVEATTVAALTTSARAPRGEPTPASAHGGGPISSTHSHGFDFRHAHGGPCASHGGSGGSGGGAGGPGGMGGAAPPVACKGTAPATALITDFADAVAGTPISFGTPPSINGGAFSYAAPGLTAPALSLVPAPGSGGAGTSSQVLSVVSNPGAASDPSNTWFGFGLFFNSCVDATAYTGVKFTVTGDLGDCAIRYATTYSENVSPSDDPRGTCTEASCFPPSMPVTSTGTTIVHFTDNGLPGSPNVIDPTSIIGIQWQMDTLVGAACTASFTISDVSFVNDAGAAVVNYTFDTGTQGWAFSQFDGAPFTNLALATPNGGATASLTFNATDGDPNPGSLQVTAPFTDFNQYVDPVVHFGFGFAGRALNLSGRTLHTRVRLVSGSFPAGGVQFHASTGDQFIYAAAPFVGADTLLPGRWLTVDFDLGTVTTAGFDPTQVVELGVQFFSGAPGGTFPGTGTGPAVFEIDTVTD